MAESKKKMKKAENKGSINERDLTADDYIKM